MGFWVDLLTAEYKIKRPRIAVQVPAMAVVRRLAVTAAEPGESFGTLEHSYCGSERVRLGILSEY